jgi:replicative superfamily II helicase
MDNFNLKQFLVENKLTENSRLGEIKAIPGNTGLSNFDDEDDDDFDLNDAYLNSQYVAPYEDVLNIIESYEDEDMLNDFINEFPEGEPINRTQYDNFVMDYIDDMSEVSFIQANWVSIWDDDIYEKAGLI